MKFLLVGINAKYIHSNPGIYSLKAYAEKQLELLWEKEQNKNDNTDFCLRQTENQSETDNRAADFCKAEKKNENSNRNSNRKDGLQNNSRSERIEIKLLEFTINQQVSEIRRTIYQEKPDWIGISCYIWNIETVKRMTPELAKLLPSLPIWLGGPEVSFHVTEILETMPEVTGIISGEGEETFFQLVKCYGLTEPDFVYDDKYNGKDEIYNTYKFNDKQGEKHNTYKYDDEQDEKHNTYKYNDKQDEIHNTYKYDEQAAEIVRLNKRTEINNIYHYNEEDTMTDFAEVPNAIIMRRLKRIKGIAFRNETCIDELKKNSPAICVTPPADPLDMDTLPFPYNNMDAFENRIIYYETSRGCPFRCAYCLSGIDRKLRFRNMDLVRKELSFFLEHKVKQVKFVDRTFNIGHEHSLEILHYIKEHDNGITNFHFEIAADILTEEEIELLKSLRPGLVQLEIGVQSTNITTLSLVHRQTNLKKLQENTARLKENRNIHLHLDLIAGLPGENLESFIQSFHQVYAMGGDELQLGFLKLLKGSPMEDLQAQYELVTEDVPPYEVLRTKDLSYEDIILLKDVEEMLELYHNSRQFCFAESYFFPQYSEFKTSYQLVDEKTDSVNSAEDSKVGKARIEPFDFYAQLAAFYHKKKEPVINSSRVRRYEILLEYFIDKEERQEQENGGKELKKGQQTKFLKDMQVKETGEKEFLKEQAKFLKDMQTKEAGEKKFMSDLLVKGIGEKELIEINKFRELLTLDYYHRENAKARPDFALPQTEFKNLIYDFYKEEEQKRKYLTDYEGYDSKQLQRMTHLEILRYAGDGNVNAVLFDYHHRNPVTGGCRLVPVKL